MPFDRTDLMKRLPTMWGLPSFVRRQVCAIRFSLAGAVLLVACCVLTIVDAQDVKNVLIRHGDNANHPANAIAMGVFHQSGSDPKTHVFGEYIGEDRLGGSGKRLERMLRTQHTDTWEQDKWYLLSGIIALVLQLALIVLLILEIRRRKKSELANKDLSGRLIDAAEEERRRIARELHDDIGQRLALVSLKLNMIDVPQDAARNNSLQEPVQELDELVGDIHNLSHQLHSTKLQVLGLTPALRDVCKQIGRQYDTHIRLVVDDVPLGLPEDISLCFYRVAQEALSNAVKYSRSNRVDLRVFGGDGRLGMTIRDYGAGFDTSAKSTGLGLATMRERMRLVGGRLSVTSTPGVGTEIKAKLKLKYHPSQEKAAA